jgi:hypothetical protein
MALSFHVFLVSSYRSKSSSFAFFYRLPLPAFTLVLVFMTCLLFSFCESLEASAAARLHVGLGFHGSLLSRILGFVLSL